jgi:hypothetical protein
LIHHPIEAIAAIRDSTFAWRIRGSVTIGHYRLSDVVDLSSWESLHNLKNPSFPAMSATPIIIRLIGISPRLGSSVAHAQLEGHSKRPAEGRFPGCFSLQSGSPPLLKGFANNSTSLFNGLAEDRIYESMEESYLRLFENNGRSDRSGLDIRDQTDLPIF